LDVRNALLPIFIVRNSHFCKICFKTFINNFIEIYVSEINHTQHKEGVVEYFLRFNFCLLFLFIITYVLVLNCFQYAKKTFIVCIIHYTYTRCLLTNSLTGITHISDVTDMTYITSPRLVGANYLCGCPKLLAVGHQWIQNYFLYNYIERTDFASLLDVLLRPP